MGTANDSSDVWIKQNLLIAALSSTNSSRGKASSHLQWQRNIYANSTSPGLRANKGSNENSTPSSRWGWVKASMSQSDASSDMSNKATPVEIEVQSQATPPWKSRLRSNEYPQSPCTPSPGLTRSPISSSATSSTSSDYPDGTVVVTITDPESEFKGKTVHITPEMCQSLDGSPQKRSATNDGNRTVFTNGYVVMANSWKDFNSIPETKGKSSVAQVSDSKPNVNTVANMWQTKSTHKKYSKWNSPSPRFNKQSEDREINSDDDDNKSESGESPPSDLINLTHLHEPAVVYCLRHRYAEDEIYTATGPILLALNPFKDCSHLYAEKMMKKYREQGEAIVNGTLASKDMTTTQSTRRKPKIKKHPPHVFATADSAFREMMRSLEDHRSLNTPTSAEDEIKTVDQSILVSGESGAGKTVTTKIIMKYFAMLSKRISSGGDVKSGIRQFRMSKPKMSTSLRYGRTSGEEAQYAIPNTKVSNIEQQVLESNPILESFGNARTIRNDNSSRFGKFIEIKFSSIGKLVGASVETYLLEKVRLIKHSEGERNYHIFYELLKGALPNERKRLLIGYCSPADFAMTASQSETYTRRDGIGDESTFKQLRTALNAMGFGGEEQMSIFEIVSALLHLSNLTFLENARDECALDFENPSSHAALELLGVSGESLDTALCSVNMEVAGDRVVKKLGLAQAHKALEALIKATYGALFVYLVKKINHCINGKGSCNDDSQSILEEKKNSQDECEDMNSDPNISSDSKPAAFIGLLDIFGFESFEKNSFEQLCINYCNESLQQQFNKFVFKLEQVEYEKEGISWNFIEFPDNQNVLDLIDKKKTGILSILDEQCMMNQCTDQSFANCVYEKCVKGKNDNPFSADTRQMANGMFSIQHYAGSVEYDTNGFLEKNKDELPNTTVELMRDSENIFLQKLVQTLDASSPRENDSSFRSTQKFRRQNSLKKISVGAQFSSQLTLLRKRIEMTTPHYIRCLKPNDALTCNNFDSAVIADQLKCAGILEAVRVSRVGFPQRYTHSQFVTRYQILAMKELHVQRQGSSNHFSAPDGFRGFHGNCLANNRSTAKNRRYGSNRNGSPALTAQQECKILVTALARKYLTSETENLTSSSQTANTSSFARGSRTPNSLGNHFTSSSMKYSSYRSTLKASSFKTSRPQTKDLNEIGIQLGNSKVFLRQHAFDILEVFRGKITSISATKINSLARMCIQRKRYRKIRDAYRAALQERHKYMENAENRNVTAGEFFSKNDNNVKQNFSENKIYFAQVPAPVSPSEMTADVNIEKEYKWKFIDNRWIRSELVNDFD